MSSIFTHVLQFLTHLYVTPQWMMRGASVWGGGDDVPVCLFAPPANVMSGLGSGSGLQVIDSPLLTQQIEAQRLCIKQLKNENNRLKV